jgi:hypothetical protein
MDIWQGAVGPFVGQVKKAPTFGVGEVSMIEFSGGGKSIFSGLTDWLSPSTTKKATTVAGGTPIPKKGVTTTVQNTLGGTPLPKKVPVNIPASGWKAPTWMPSVGTVAKVGTVGTVAVGGTYLAYKGVTGLGSVIDNLVGNGPTKKDGAAGADGAAGLVGATGSNGLPGGAGFTNPYADFWGNLSSGLGQGLAGPGVGAGAGLSDIGAGIGNSVVPIVLIGGGVLLAEKYMKNGKGRTYRKR